MKKMLLVGLAAMATTACSPMMYAGGRHYPPHPSFVQRPPHVEPVPSGRWDNVMRLPHGSTIDVLTADGVANVGPILGADIDSVRVAMDGVERRIERRHVVRVDLVDLAGSESGAVARKAARGALLGAGLAALVSGVIGGEAWPPPGPLLRGGAAIGGVSGGQAELMRRVGRVIYVAPEPVRNTSGAGGPITTSRDVVTCERPAVAEVRHETQLKRR